MCPRTWLSRVLKLITKITYLVLPITISYLLGKKQYRNQCIGWGLMREIETRAKKIGVETLYLEVYGVCPATGLYERLGYR